MRRTRRICCSTAIRKSGIAKSLGEWDEHSKTMQMPEWVAMQKGLI
jgi:hypothetical protein